MRQVKGTARLLAQALSSVGIALALVSCGGGGGSSSTPEASTPVRAEIQGAIVVAEVQPPCGSTNGDFSQDCLAPSRVLMSADGEFTVLWQAIDTDAEHAWRVAASGAGTSDVRSQVLLAAEKTQGLNAVDLGGRRFVALSMFDPELSSWVYDMNGSPQGQASTRTTLGLHVSAKFISGPDGAFVLGSSVSNGPIALGGGISVQGVQLGLPSGLTNLWPGYSVAPQIVSLEPAAFWAFAAAPQNSPEQRIYLASVRLPSGYIELVEERSQRPLRQQSGGPDFCSSAPTVYGLPGAVAVVWVENNASATGCDVIVDGVAVNDPAASGLMPGLSGSGSGLVAVWLERNPSPPAGYLSRVVWRSRDALTGQWSPITSFTSGSIANLMSIASGPGGTMAVAWSDCGSAAGSCQHFLSKYVHGAWTTVAFVNPTDARAIVAINAQGNAVAVWPNNTGWACSADTSKTCPRLIARRF